MTTITRYQSTVSESAMRDAIAELVSLKHGRMFWIPRSDVVPAMADWPDLVLILPESGYIVFVELKSMKRKVTPGQAIAATMLASCNKAETFIVRPVPKEGEVSYDEFLMWLGEVA